MTDTKISEARNLLAEAFGCDPEELLDGEVRAVRAVLALQSARPQPAELAEQQGVELPPLPDKVVVDKHLPTGICLYGYTPKQMQDYARAALAATGKQQVGKVQGDALVVESFGYFERAGDAGDRKYVEAIRAAIAAQQPGVE
jgi:hypothetical protein